MSSEEDRIRQKEFLRTVTVLYVEDSEDVRAQLDQYLRRRFARLMVATDGQDGLEQFRKHRPDVVVTDVLMPRMNGLEMASAIREEDPDTPIIITTAFSDVDYLLKAIEIGVDRYVIKPIDTRSLLDAIYRVARHLEEKRALEVHSRFARFVLDMHPNSLAITRDGRLEFLNHTMLRELGFDSLNAFFEAHDDIDSFIADARQERHWTSWLHDTPPADHIVHLRCADGTLKSFVVREALFPDLDRHVYSFTDVTRLEREREQLEEKAHRDSLTGIANRHAFDRALALEMRRAQRYDTALSVIMFDLDHFKNINDTWGHGVGDRVLRELVLLVQGHIRETDTFARWGGEEFMILTPGSSPDHAYKLAEKLRALIEAAEFSDVDGLTCSFGVAGMGPEEDAAQLARRVDQALYQAKRSGRNRVVCASPPGDDGAP